jgi:hypothetical protein
MDKKVNWALPGTWAWVMFMLVIGLTGTGMFWHSRQQTK